MRCKMAVIIFVSVLFLPITVSANPKTIVAEEPELLLFKSYMATIKNSAGGRMFKNLYYRLKEKKGDTDVLRGGNLSCAYFVSSVLHHFGLIGEFRTGVDNTVLEMKKNGWRVISSPRPGAVIVWDKKYNRRTREWHGHIGFYIGRGRAVSTSSSRGYPVVHSVKSWHRKIVGYLWHERLEEAR